MATRSRKSRDPSRTFLLRRAFVADARRRVRALEDAVTQFLVTDDELGLQQPKSVVVTHGGKSLAIVNAPADSPGRRVMIRGRHVFLRDWVEPPQRKPGRGVAGGFAATGEKNTDIGDLGERTIVEHLGMESLLPAGKRQNPLDVVRRGTNRAYEVKTVTTYAKMYRVAMKPDEVKSKLAYARRNKLRPNMLVLVLDPDRGEAYAYERPGIGSYRLSAKAGWRFLGKMSVGGGGGRVGGAGGRMGVATKFVGDGFDDDYEVVENPKDEDEDEPSTSDEEA